MTERSQSPRRREQTGHRKQRAGTGVRVSQHHSDGSQSASAKTDTDDIATQLLEILADDTAREVLSVTADESLTVADIVDRCEIPIATVYRKVNGLYEVGMLDRSVRIRPHGKNVSEYSLTPKTARVDIATDGTLSVELSVSHAKTDERPRLAVTDGGTQSPE